MPSFSNSNTLPTGTQIGRTALRVSDLEEMSEFYSTVVGFDVLEQSERTTILGVGESEILVLEYDGTLSPRHSTAAGLYHNAFRLPTRAAIGDALGRVRDHWELAGASNHRVSEALYLTDPEGNGIELYRDFPREEWPRTADGRISMATHPLDLEGIEGDTAGRTGLPAGTDVGHVHLEVTSLEVFREFYVETLGFEVQASVRGALFVSAGGYHHHVGANVWQQRTAPAEGRGLSWFEVVVPDRESLETIRDRLLSRGVPVSSTDGGIALSDSDDNEIRLRD